jgi:hypothetical protein
MSAPLSGPWKVAPILRDIHFQDWFQVVDSRGGKVALVTADDARARAAARLIAAAPLLLAACEEAASAADIPPAVAARLRAAIAAAKGARA